MTQQRFSQSVALARRLNITSSQVETVVTLLDDGATVPFIARYRKEATKGLNDQQLRDLFVLLHEVRELDARRLVILESIKKQEKMTPQLEELILCAENKNILEDLYAPFKPVKHTKAQIAIEAGLQPLAFSLYQNPDLDPQEQAANYLNPEKSLSDVKTILEGAQAILMEHFAQDVNLISEFRKTLWDKAILSAAAKKKDANNSKYADYCAYSETIKTIPSHRAMALFRGRREGMLQLDLKLPPQMSDFGLLRMSEHFNIHNQNRCADEWLLGVLEQTWKLRIKPKLELELLSRLRESADEEAIKVFSKNLRDLLLAAPAGPRVTLGLDPGIRTGVKIAIVDEMGTLLDTGVIFPFAPQNEWNESIAFLAKCIIKHRVDLISIGNGTGSRETDRLVTDLIKRYPDIKITKALVSEAGASVYSASELAAKEFPDLDVTLRGAVSIARRIQDPLAELVKIEPKSIGAGQYQHDVNPKRLVLSMDGVVEDCVNAVGVDVNTASLELLTHIAGLNEGLAKKNYSIPNHPWCFYFS